MDRLLIDTHARFATHFCAAHDDLGKARELLHDAIAKLLENFEDLHRLIVAQQSPLPDAAPVIAGQSAIPARADAVVASAVTALQFQDMVEQLLQHSMRRLDCMHAAWLRMGELAGRELDGAPLSQCERAQIGSEMIALFERADQLNACIPVRQQHMQSGAIELF